MYIFFNVFYTDPSPKISAKNECDEHARKMVLETGQILSTVQRLIKGVPVKFSKYPRFKVKKFTNIINNKKVKCNYTDWKPGKNHRTLERYFIPNSYKEESTLYEVTHKKHPCVLWAMESVSNYKWLYDHFIALLDENYERYSKRRAEEKLRLTLKDPPSKMIDKGFSQPPQAMPEEYRSENSVEAYRTFYIRDKSKFATWKKTNPPEWYIEGIKKL